MKLPESVRAAVRGGVNFVKNRQGGPDVHVVDPADVRGESEKDWTVLVYLDGRNRLARSSMMALNKMEQVGSTQNVNVVAQATIEPTWRELHHDNMAVVPTRRYFITQDDNTDAVTSPCVGEPGGSLPLNQDNLADFLKWGVKEFPAKHYMVVIKKHGAGFAKIGDHAPLSARELQGALKDVQAATGKQMEVVSFDSCSMQQMEVAYQIKDQAKVMTGSPEDILANSYPYGTLLENLTSNPKAEANQVGKMVVDAYRQAVPRGIQAASDLTKLGSFAKSMHAFTSELINSQVPRDLLYTSMLNTKSMEGQETQALQFNFRDLGGFIAAVVKDERYPQNVRDAALEARKSMNSTLVDGFATQGRIRLKKPTGYSTFVPWKALGPELKEAYGKLDYVHDSGWMNLLDYVFDGPEIAKQPMPKAENHDSILKNMAKLPLKHYKKYVSGYLPTACQYTPSCSQYARQAIETHGMMKGGWMSFLRVLSCNGHKSEGPDPVPGHCGHNHSAPDLPAGTAIPEFITPPPVTVNKSQTRRNLEASAIAAAGIAGGLVGGIAGAVCGLPVGIAAGGFFGYKVGSGKMDEFTSKMLETQREATVYGMLQIARPIGKPADAINQAVAQWTGSQKVADVVAGVTGPVVGVAAGALGGMAVGFAQGSRFGRPWGANLLKDKLGELPVHPENEAIVERDYN